MDLRHQIKDLHSEVWHLRRNAAVTGDELRRALDDAEAALRRAVFAAGRGPPLESGRGAD